MRDVGRNVRREGWRDGGVKITEGETGRVSTLALISYYKQILVSHVVHEAMLHWPF